MSEEKTPQIQLPPPVSGALERVLRHFWCDEQRDFETASKKERKQHIFPDLALVERWLRNPTEEPDYFADCPRCECGGNDGYINVHHTYWFVCHVHKLKWCGGTNLFISWRGQPAEEWEENATRLKRYKEIAVPARF